MDHVRDTANQTRRLNLSIEEGSLDPDRLKTLLHHPLPTWLASMVEHYVLARGGRLQRTMSGCNITFPDGVFLANVVFRPGSNDIDQTYVALDHPEIKKMLEELPCEASGVPLARVVSPQFTKGLQGIWSLWELGVWYGNDKERRILPLFISKEGRLFRASAFHIWEQLTHPNFQGEVVFSESKLDEKQWQKLHDLAEKETESLYQELKQAHVARIDDERVAMEQAFHVRRDMIKRVGLANVRSARLGRLDEEHALREMKLGEAARIHPELRLIMVLEVDAS